MTRWTPPRYLALSWLGLLACLAATVAIAYLPLGRINFPVSLLIAATKAWIVAFFFMELRKGSTLTVTFASAGIFWLGIMFWLAFSDYVTRPQFP